MSQDQRFTCWLSDREREGIERIARESNTSINYVVRVAIRELLTRAEISESVSQVDHATR